MAPPSESDEHVDPDDDGWVPVEGVDEPAESVALDDIDLIADLTHPVRGAIVRRLRRPRTVAQLATALDAPITRLYHHVNRLDDIGLIRVVATRRVGAVTERQYQSAARSFRLADEIFESLEPHQLAVALGSLFDVAKIGLQRGVESGLFQGVRPDDDEMALSLGEVHVTPGRRTELITRIRDLLEEFSSDTSEDDPDSIKMTLFIAAYPDS